MIIDIPNHEAIADLEESKRHIMAEIDQARIYLHSYSAQTRIHAEAQLEQLNAQLKTANATQILPESTLFVPGKLSGHQVHALTGTKHKSTMTSAKALRYALETALISVFVAASVIAIVQGNHQESAAAFGIALVLILSTLWHSIDDFMPLIDKKRIANVDTGAITTYELDGDLTVELQTGLGAALWQRLVSGLRAGDPELESAFERYCKGMAWYNERRIATDKICKVDPSEANKRLHCDAIAEARVFAKAAVVKIIAMFEQRDEEASRVKDATETAARQLESEELQNQLLVNARISGIIETELKYNKPVF